MCPHVPTCAHMCMTKNAQRLTRTHAHTQIQSRKAADFLDLPQRNPEKHPVGLKSQNSRKLWFLLSQEIKKIKLQNKWDICSSHFYTLSNGYPKGFFFLRISVYASGCTVPSFSILTFNIQKNNYFLCLWLWFLFSVENWISCQTYCPTHRSINAKWCCQWHWYGGAEGALLPCCWAHEPRGTAKMAEMGKLWRGWGNCGRNGKMWQDTAGTTGGVSVLGQTSLPQQTVLIFPREKAECWMEAAPGFGPWHYFDLDCPDFMVAADKIKY